MSLKRGFFWGKISGIIVGGTFGTLSYSLPFLLKALLDGECQVDFVQIVFLSFWGGVAGVFLGAMIGTAVGMIIAWTETADNAPTIWLVVWAIAALFTSLLTLADTAEANLMMPAVWVWFGGVVGWYGGLLYQSQAAALLQKIPVA